MYLCSQKVKNGETVQLEGPVYSDLFQQKRLLLNGVQLDVTFFQNSDSFTVKTPNAANNYQFEITEAVLKICHVQLNPGIIVAHSTGQVRYTDLQYSKRKLHLEPR